MTMKTQIATALAALAVGTLATLAVPATAQAADRSVTCNDGTVYHFGPDDAISNEVACANHGGVKPDKPLRVSGSSQRNAVPDGTFGGKNKAVAWTAGCYAEFGPNATHPDAALLEKCLGN